MAQPAEMERLVAKRPTLAAWLAEYDAIGQEYVDGLAGFGIDFAPRNQDTAARQAVLQRLREKGARFRNGGASISCGPLSSACVACADDNGSRTFYLSLSCNRDCYFCFNKNQVNYEADKLLKKNWRAEVDEFLDGDVPVTHVALTGGEPLLHPAEALAFFAHVKAKAPQAHLRLYSDGDFLDESLAAQLAQAGLQELRLSVKPDELGAFDEAVRRLAMAKRHIPEVMVEMPVAPEMKEEMKGLLRGMDAIGAFGVNLLEFGYPMGDWAPFAQRGYRIANPPFAIPYEYTYAGGLPVARQRAGVSGAAGMGHGRRPCAGGALLLAGEQEPHADAPAEHPGAAGRCAVAVRHGRLFLENRQGVRRRCAGGPAAAQGCGRGLPKGRR